MPTENGLGQIVPTLDASYQTPYRVESLTGGFVMSDAVYPGSPLPVHERWTIVLAWAKPAREHGIFHDYSDYFAEAYASGCSQQTFAALELANLQLHFFQFMIVNNLTFRHVVYMHFVSAQVWNDRLGAAFNIMVENKREKPMANIPKLPKRPRNRMH